MKIFRTLMITLAAAALLLGAHASADPVQLDASGTVTSATGTWAGDVSSPFTASVIIDLDSANAYAINIDSPSGTRWTFLTPHIPSSDPYKAVFAGAFGSLDSHVVTVETLDNLDLDAAGNPFGLSGIADIMTIQGSTIVVACMPIEDPDIDPLTGECNNPSAVELEGDEFLLILAHTTDWFSGNNLPTSIPDQSGLIGVAGEGRRMDNSVEIAESEITYSSFTVSPFTAVPALGPIAIGVTAGLLGILGMRRIRG
ncbi:MAG TPA: hypothetical protein EYQ66_06650 [Myxococcales bacterium]|nr:hypothetical protein [Myxococcales bacterium]